MITIPFWLGELALALIWLAVRVCIWLKNKKIDWKRERLHILMYINLIVIIYFTFSPLCLDLNEIFNCRINLIPFVYLLDYDSGAHMIYNVFGNIFMFVPTGIVLPVLYKRLDNFFKVVGTGFLISLSIEILQLPFADRASDVDDLIMNTLGVATGYVIYMIVRYAKSLGKQKANRPGVLKQR